jgi:hypothetical protein
MFTFFTAIIAAIAFQAGILLLVAEVEFQQVCAYSAVLSHGLAGIIRRYGSLTVVYRERLTGALWRDRMHLFEEMWAE